MQPAFTCPVVALAVHVFVQNVGVVPVQPPHLLFQSLAGVLHQLTVAALPQVPVAFDGASDPAAHRLHDVLVAGVTVERPRCQ